MPRPITPASAALGAAVRQLRTDRGLTQEDLAHASGLHPTYLSGVETGHRNPTWASLGRIARALDVRMSELARLAERLEARP